MFKVRMQGQYGAATDQRLSAVVRDMWQQWGFRKGIMRGFWGTGAREIPAYAGCVFFDVPSSSMRISDPHNYIAFTLVRSFDRRFGSSTKPGVS